MRNSIEFRLSGNYALFSDPITRLGGEKSSYLIPTYEALKGICESIYWKPTIIWYVDKVRVIKPIRSQTKGVKPQKYVKGCNDLAIYTYLSGVEYQVQAHFEWNYSREDLIQDRDEDKHYLIAQRMLSKGGKRDIFLGVSECGGYVEPCVFGQGAAYYDNIDMDFGVMFHGFDYPSQTGREMLVSRFWIARMEKGVVSFPRPDQCVITKDVREMKNKPVKALSVDEELRLEEEDGIFE